MAVFLGQAVINRQHLEKMICRGESYLSNDILLIVVRQAVPKISALKVLKYFPKIRVHQNRGTFAAVFLGQAVINRQNPEKMICRRESYLSKNIFLIAVRQTVPKILALKLCLYFPKIGAKNFFSWEKGFLNFSIRGSLSYHRSPIPF